MRFAGSGGEKAAGNGGLRRATLLVLLLGVLFAAALLVSATARAQDDAPESEEPVGEAQLDTPEEQQILQQAVAEQDSQSGDLAGETAAAEDRNEDGLIDRITIPVAGCAIGQGATISFRDDNGEIGVVVDGFNAFITSTGDAVIVRGTDPDSRNEPIFFIARDELQGSELTVTGSTGIECEQVTTTPTDPDETTSITEPTTGETTNEDSVCPGATTALRDFEGSGISQTPPFTIVGDRFRVNYALETEDPDLSLFIVDVIDNDSQESVDFFSEETGESGSTLVNAGPGEFFLDISGANIRYTITVEDCVEAGETTTPGGTSPSDNVIVSTIPPKDPPVTGGLPFTGGTSVIVGAATALVLFGAGLSLFLLGARRRS
jgi:hypothetical protein